MYGTSSSRSPNNTHRRFRCYLLIGVRQIVPRIQNVNVKPCTHKSNTGGRSLWKLSHKKSKDNEINLELVTHERLCQWRWPFHKPPWSMMGWEINEACRCKIVTHQAQHWQAPLLTQFYYSQCQTLRNRCRELSSGKFFCELARHGSSSLCSDIIGFRLPRFFSYQSSLGLRCYGSSIKLSVYPCGILKTTS